MRICIILPVYNHPHYLAELFDYLSTLHIPIIVVNDGSDTVCRGVIDTLEKKYSITVLHHDENSGKGQAVMTGLCYAKKHGFSHALQLDVDGQHHWSDVLKFVEMAKHYPQAMIIGKPTFDATVPRHRLYGRYATHIWVWINSLSLEITDSMCGFRVYPVDAAYDVIRKNRLQPRMGFDSEILVRLSWAGTAFINIETPVIYPENGISHFNVWRDNLGLSKTHTRLFFGMLWRSPKLIARKLSKK